MKKRIGCFSAVLLLSVLMSSTAFADEWKCDDKGWWWEFTNGSYPTSCWQWIDGDADGVVECYYFAPDGYLLTNTTTPDGYQVNENGAWVQDGEVQQKAYHAELGHRITSPKETVSDIYAGNGDGPVLDGHSVEKITVNSELFDLVRQIGSLNFFPNRTEIEEDPYTAHFFTYMVDYHGVPLRVEAYMNNGEDCICSFYGPAKMMLNNIPEQGIEFNAFYDNFGYESRSTGRRPMATTGQSDQRFGLPTGSYRMLWCDVNKRFFEILLTETKDGKYYITPDSPMYIN